MDLSWAKARASALWSAIAIPGYILLAWSWIGTWSRAEFVIRKMREFAELPYASTLMMLAGFGWLAWLVTRKPSKTAVRLQKVRELLAEAEQHLRESKPVDYKQEVHGMFKEAAKKSFELLQVDAFLQDAFAHHVVLDYRAYADRERRISEEAGIDKAPERRAATYLARLRQRITERDLDGGFSLPHTYRQYRESSKWPPNTRPVPEGENVP